MRGFLAAGAGAPGTAVGIKLGAGVAKAVSKTMVAKGVFSLAAKGITKVVAGVLAKAKLGGFIGGVAGNIPGAIGGALGGIVLAVGADKLFLELEEAMNRSEFRAALVEALNHERQKMLDIVKSGVSTGRTGRKEEKQRNKM